jgi:anthranilate synthase/aminodeoxychorismate synthase-like glutamine amidotransferase
MLNILLIDNNDSFTYNIVDYLRRMSDIKFKVIKSHNIILNKINGFDKIIISPGPGLPKDFPKLSKIFSLFLECKPILGICLGHQALVEFLGGSLMQLHPVIHGQAHALKILKDDIIFNDIPGVSRIGLYHSWAVNEKTFPEKLDILAVSEQGIIMAIKHKEYSVYGVQFHPESHITDHGFTLLNNFIEL